ncbi:MAG: type II toxin-antitoxin system HicA family toxin [Phycisphaerales bacterium]|nr:type II toxin-antitoxin system HicA family toxin [Phycisphaerales bacterium]
MSERLPALTAREIIKVLERCGFVLVRQSGSHAIFHHADGRRTTVPIHGKRTIGRGLLRQIMRDAALDFADVKTRN